MSKEKLVTLGEVKMGDVFDSFVLISSATVDIARNNKQYISFTFEDKTGLISGKFWGASDDEVEKFTQGTVVKLAGKKEDYNGTPQVKILQLDLASDIDSSKDDATLYAAVSPFTKKEAKRNVGEFMKSIEDEDYANIVKFIYSKFKKEIFEAPAAEKVHHDFTGGLAYHTIFMCQTAQFMANQYNLNLDLLLSGILLHDVGKVIELSWDQGNKYTTQGSLIGHISLMDGEIMLAATELGMDPLSEKISVLRHLILSHHGKKEYGSPVNPLIIEAEIIHQIDKMDATMQIYNKNIKGTDSGEFSNKVFFLDNRRFYIPEN